VQRDRVRMDLEDEVRNGVALVDVPAVRRMVDGTRKVANRAVGDAEDERASWNCCNFTGSVSRAA
jgi:hypothetical protein